MLHKRSGDPSQTGRFSGGPSFWFKILALDVEPLAFLLFGTLLCTRFDTNEVSLHMMIVWADQGRKRSQE